MMPEVQVAANDFGQSKFKMMDGAASFSPDLARDAALVSGVSSLLSALAWQRHSGVSAPT